jgi:hypothetical protein
MRDQIGAIETPERRHSYYETRLNFLELAKPLTNLQKGSLSGNSAEAQAMLDGFLIADASDANHERRQSKVPASVLDISPNVTPVHADSVRDCTVSVPYQQLAQFGKAGWRIVAVKDAAEYDPSAAKQHPQGYPPGMTWENVDVITDLNKRRIVLCEYYKDFKTQKVVPSTSVIERFRHEFGHALDALRPQHLASDPVLQRMYKADVQALSATDRKDLWYYTQAGFAGPRETVAALYAIEHGGGTDNALIEKKLKSAFADVLRYMQQKGF